MPTGLVFALFFGGFGSSDGDETLQRKRRLKKLADLSRIGRDLVSRGVVLHSQKQNRTAYNETNGFHIFANRRKTYSTNNAFD